jgi:hypothetical protein
VLRVPLERVPLDRDVLFARVPLDRVLLGRDALFARVPLDRVLLARVPLERVPPDRDDVERELELRELDPPDVARFARVAAPVFAAVLRLAAARLRVAAPFFAAVERDLPAPPRALLSIVSASERSSSTVLCTSFEELSPASAIARAARLRSPLARSLLNRSASSVAFAMSPPVPLKAPWEF